MKDVFKNFRKRQHVYDAIDWLKHMTGAVERQEKCDRMFTDDADEVIKKYKTKRRAAIG